MVTSVWQIAGIVLAVLLIEFVGIMSVKKVKNASDFTTGGGRAGLWVVVGTIMGTLVGGQSTIGTAQLSFSYGISAWWFTVGAALGCVVLGIGYAIPLRYSGSTTLMEVISKEYGKKAEMTGSVLCSLGMFVSIVCRCSSDDFVPCEYAYGSFALGSSDGDICGVRRSVECRHWWNCKIDTVKPFSPCRRCHGACLLRWLLRLDGFCYPSFE